MERIAVLTGGGHVSCFNCGLYGILKEAEGKYEVLGAIKGYDGANKGLYVSLDVQRLKPHKAGSILGSSREAPDCDAVRAYMKEFGISALITMGGNDTLGKKAARRLNEEFGIPVVGWPKTMDGDLSKTYLTLGQHTAVVKGAEILKDSHANAVTNSKVVFNIVFGRDTDYSAAGIGTMGAADLTIPAEHEYSIEFIRNKINEARERNRSKFGVPFAVVSVAEGAKITELKDMVKTGKLDKYGNPVLSPPKLAVALEEMNNGHISIATNVITYELRDSAPTPLDARLAEMAGRECVRMIQERDYGKSAIIMQDLTIRRAPLSEVSKQKFFGPTGFMDYEKMQTTPAFSEYYANAFGKPPKKEEIMEGLWIPKEDFCSYD